MITFKEYLLELSAAVKQSHNDKATPQIVQLILKGNKQKAVKRAQAVSKIAKQLSENEYPVTPEDEYDTPKQPYSPT